MVSRYRHRRTSNPATAFPGQIEPGEIAVNTANRQLAAGDASGGTLGNPLTLLAVRVFDARAQYAIGDFTVQGGQLYRAKATISPGAFNAANWDQYFPAGALNASGVVFTPAGQVGATNVQSAIAEIDSEKAPLVSPIFTGDPQAPTPATADNDTSIATTAFVKAQGFITGGPYALLASPVFTGDPQAPTPALADNDTSIATTGYVKGQNYAPLASPVFIGDPQAPTPTAGDSDTSIATTAFVQNAIATQAGGKVAVSDTPPASPTDGSLWWESDSGLLYIRYNDGDSSQWVVAGPFPDSALNVRYDVAQTLTSAQQVQARQNIYAAPFDALAYSGMQINGSCEISQERGNTSFALVNGTGAYVSDGWRAQFGAAATLAVSCFPLDTNAPPGFQFNTAVLASTGLASLAANDYVILQHFIEGWRMARLAWGSANAQPITISFWVMTNVTGTFAVAIRNGATNRSYVADVVVPTALVWQWVTLTIPGDTTGTWPKDNTRGMEIDFCCGAGSALKVATPSTWMAAGNLATASTTNFVNAAGNGIRVTGLVVLPGTQAPTAVQSPFVMRSADQELLTCRRYLWRRTFSVGGTIPIGMLEAYSTTLAGGPLFTLHPEMRIPPVITISNIGHFGVMSAVGAVVGSVTLNWATATDTVWLNTSTFSASLAGGNAAMFFTNNASAWMQMDARL